MPIATAATASGISARCGSSASTQAPASGIDIDRKVLADIAVREPEAFKALVDQAQSALAA